MTFPTRKGLCRARAAALIIALVPAISACDVFETITPPETARLTVSAPGDDPLHIVTSTNFFGAGEQVEFVEADTAIVVGSYQQSYPIRGRAGFAVRVTSPESEEPRPVTVEVFIDEVSRYNPTQEISGEDHMQFVYFYN